MFCFDFFVLFCLKSILHVTEPGMLSLVLSLCPKHFPISPLQNGFFFPLFCFLYSSFHRSAIPCAWITQEKRNLGIFPSSLSSWKIGRTKVKNTEKGREVLQQHFLFHLRQKSFFAFSVKMLPHRWTQLSFLSFFLAFFWWGIWFCYCFGTRVRLCQ